MHLSGNFVHFRKSHVRADRLDVQETNFSPTQFDRISHYYEWTTFPLDPWDLVIEVLHSSFDQAQGHELQAQRNKQRNKSRSKHTNTQINTQIHHNVSNVDYVSSNVNSSRYCALLYNFSMIMKR